MVSTSVPQFVSRQRPTAGQHVVPALCFEDTPPKIEDFPRGYPSLAAFLASDNDFTMFRCFSRLHTRLLLHKQDELAELEQRLDQLDRDESRTNPYLLATNRRRGMNTDRQKLFAEVEEKLNEYNSLLKSHLEHLERPGPEEPNIKSVLKWMDGKKPLTYAESAFLKDWGDLRGARPSVEKGGLEGLLGRFAASIRLAFMRKVFWPLKASSKTSDPNVILIKQSSVIAASRLLTMISAVLTLVVPIGILYEVEDMVARLWIIAGFTTLFSSALCWLTSSRNYEIFSATAAYSAVMVVFVGNLPST